MTQRWQLDMDALEDDFFGESVMIGLATALPAYRLCALLNQRLDMGLSRDPDSDKFLHTRQKQKICFPVFQYYRERSGEKHFIYTLKSGKELLLPELKQLDYLWLMHSGITEQEATLFVSLLRKMSEIQLAQFIERDRLKQAVNLLT